MKYLILIAFVLLLYTWSALAQGPGLSVGGVGGIPMGNTGLRYGSIGGVPIGGTPYAGLGAAPADCEKDSGKTQPIWEMTGEESFCYRVDAQTQGEKFHKLACDQTSRECSALMPPTHYVWEKVGSDSFCYRVDNETGGQKFRHFIAGSDDDRECSKAMPPTHYVWEKIMSSSFCYRVDNETEGSNFHQYIYNQDERECSKAKAPETAQSGAGQWVSDTWTKLLQEVGLGNSKAPASSTAAPAN